MGPTEKTGRSPAANLNGVGNIASTNVPRNGSVETSARSTNEPRLPNSTTSDRRKKKRREKKKGKKTMAGSRARLVRRGFLSETVCTYMRRNNKLTGVSHWFHHVIRRCNGHFRLRSVADTVLGVLCVRVGEWASGRVCVCMRRQVGL